MIDGLISDHLDALCKILSPYKGNRHVDALPGALRSVLKAHAASLASDSAGRAQLLSDLDRVTEIIGRIGEITTEEEFERIKEHYATIQVFASKIEDRTPQ